MMAKRIVAAVMATAIVGGGYWLVWQSPWLTVKKLTITVAPPLRQVGGASDWRDPGIAKRVRAAIPDVLGEHVVEVDARALQSAAAAVRGVADVEVRRGWPDAIVVAVTPAVPVAYVSFPVRSGANGTPAGAGAVPTPRPSAIPTPRETFMLIDYRGAVVDEIAQAPAQLPRLNTSVDTAGGRAALEVLTQLPPWLRTQVTAIGSLRPGSEDTVRIELARSRSVVWGSSDLSARKAQVLRVLVKHKARVYDVSAPEVPTTRG